MIQIQKLVITIECQPKKGKSDKLDAALWKAIEKYSTGKEPHTLQTNYIYEEAKEA